MSQAILTLTHAFVSKGYNGKPQTTFTKNENNEYGVLRFKVSIKKTNKKDAKNEYDNYSIDWRNVKADNKIIPLLNQPGVRVCINGETTQEEFNGVKFVRLTAEGRNAIIITTYSDQKANVSSGAPASDTSFDPSSFSYDNDQL